MTQGELGEKVGHVQAVVSRVEHGERSLTAFELNAYAHVFDLATSVLFDTAVMVVRSAFLTKIPQAPVPPAELVRPIARHIKLVR